MRRPSTPEPNTGAPRWVKVSAAIAVVLILIGAGMLAAGHNPARHLAGLGSPPAPPVAGNDASAASAKP